MSVGANIVYTTRKQTLQQILSLMGFKPNGASRGRSKICYKAGAPANNTAADNPNALYDILYDGTNGRVYICTLFSANASATTWTRIV